MSVSKLGVGRFALHAVGVQLHDGRIYRGKVSLPHMTELSAGWPSEKKEEKCMS